MNNGLKLPDVFFQASSVGIVVLDADYTMLQVNPGFIKTVGFNLAEIQYKNIASIFDLFSSNTQKEDIKLAIKETGFWRGDARVIRKEDDVFSAIVLIDSAGQSDGKIKNYVVLILDISDRKQLEHELRYHSEIDPLTNLANRKLFFQRLDNAIASAKRFNYNVALLYLDLDGFKQVNDSFGHGEGDEVLIEVAQRLRRCVREVDTVARLGGDEFVIILNGTDKEMVADTAQRIIETLTLTISQNDIALPVSASIGIAIYPDDSVNPATLLKYADAAMYAAKFKGKRQYCWHK